MRFKMAKKSAQHSAYRVQQMYKKDQRAPIRQYVQVGSITCERERGYTEAHKFGRQTRATSHVCYHRKKAYH